MDVIYDLAQLGRERQAVDRAYVNLRAQQVIERIWSKDYTVWAAKPDEISNRLGWLDIAERMVDQVPRMEKLRANLRAEGFDRVLLLGMGGSSLAPEVFANTFGRAPGGLDLAVLDSTNPDVVKRMGASLDLARTIFIVATKSGGTTETLSFFKHFYNLVGAEVGWQAAGAHFVAITDPGSSLVDLAAQHQFRDIFLNDPEIGGRYSALSFFGLLPAALLGVDVAEILMRAQQVGRRCANTVVNENPGAVLGAILGALAESGRDKATLVLSPVIANFGDWIEQLIAESTGKNGRGILPVVGEPLGPPTVYAKDRMFIHLRMDGDGSRDTELKLLENAGFPVVRIQIKDRDDLGGQFFLWEMATAVAGWQLAIQPFDQPNVESAKILARRMMAAYQEEGFLPGENPKITTERMQVYGGPDTNTPSTALREFLATGLPVEPGGTAARGYAAIQAYVDPIPEVLAALGELRILIRDRFKLATTLGIGPRFLHSTGQLHKGDAGLGLFIQITSDSIGDIPIPDTAGAAESAATFGVLLSAQAMGDRQALLDAGREVIRFHVRKDLPAVLQELIRGIREG